MSLSLCRQHLSDSMTYSAWILGVFLVYAGTMLVSMKSTPVAFCTPLNTVRESLNFSQRRTYMKYNFPINYTIKVHHEEVLRLSNISKLKAALRDLHEEDLQELWLFVNLEILKKMLKVLPEKHPSYRYTSDLEELFKKVQQFFQELKDSSEEQRELPERIQKIWDKVKDPNAKLRKLVKPKALLDNCYRTMHCLFPDCFPVEDEQPDYCSVQYWRKSNKTTKVPQESTPTIKEAA